MSFTLIFKHIFFFQYMTFVYALWTCAQNWHFQACPNWHLDRFNKELSQTQNSTKFTRTNSLQISIFSRSSLQLWHEDFQRSLRFFYIFLSWKYRTFSRTKDIFDQLSIVFKDCTIYRLVFDKTKFATK